jgi:hypothetical protein
VPELGRHRAGQGQHSPEIADEIADEIAPLIHSDINQFRVAGLGTASSGNEGNTATKNRRMIRDSFPEINSPGQASVSHARGFS